ncbi:MAG: hypothetical protein HOP29_03650 [Phycisphaerales bacterium]|nr:hypothetical protein [Phycisphaerales bacterium]
MAPSVDRCARPRGRRARAAGRSSAFTLVEMTAVLFVMAILVLLVLPDVASSNRTYRLQSAAHEVLAALQFAQSQSIQTGTSYGCETSMSANTMRCFQVVGAPPYPTVNHPVKKTSYAVDFDTLPGHGGISITASTFASETVTFDSLGSPSSGGFITVSLSGYSRRTNVSAITGRMEFSDP